MKPVEKIPRIIHYCWFGRNEKPKKIIKCMKSWYKMLSGYQFIEWNEDNFDIGSNTFVKQAYDARKYAFVSDYVRLYALYHHGGIYMDTDVEVLQPLDRFLLLDAVSGFEDVQYVQSAFMAFTKNHFWIKELLDDYQDKPFVLPDGSLDMTTNTAIMTRSCVQYGFVPNGEYQVLLNGVTLYPRTFFCPYDYINGANYITGDSYTIHHFAKSWLPLHVRVRSEIKRSVSRYAGPAFILKMRSILSGR